MIKNVGIIEKILRIVTAITIIVLFVMGKLPGLWGLLLIFSGSLLMTVSTGYCPIWVPFKINTTKIKVKKIQGL